MDFHQSDQNNDKYKQQQQPMNRNHVYLPASHTDFSKTVRQPTIKLNEVNYWREILCHSAVMVSFIRRASGVKQFPILLCDFARFSNLCKKGVRESLESWICSRVIDMVKTSKYLHHSNEMSCYCLSWASKSHGWTFPGNVFFCGVCYILSWILFLFAFIYF